MDFANLPTVLSILTFAVVALIGALRFKSGLAKARQEETDDLVETRGQKIMDLREEVRGLTALVHRLEAKVQALEDQNIERIADAVADRVRPMLNTGGIS